MGEEPDGGERESESAVLYLHGGGYIVGSSYGYRPLVGALVAAAGVDALVPDFRLAPEHPFPAALDDSVAAYRGLLADGTDPRHIALMGDSAGGGLVLAANLAVRVGLLADYAPAYRRAVRHALDEGQIEAAFSIGFVGRHLVEFTREALRGEQNASFYSAAAKSESGSTAPLAEPAHTAI